MEPGTTLRKLPSASNLSPEPPVTPTHRQLQLPPTTAKLSVIYYYSTSYAFCGCVLAGSYLAVGSVEYSRSTEINN
ncbi:hypothetical protein E2C01_024119 [Portunus trituberculatus]|uniref:Uncharacterized protein n=1 Tax=Portunus trituberculatus TaxID=210409 RepID=A0A5B7EBU8_PORTR|nr:hypothetical protein [Portunus trituberculatus]